MRNNITPTHEKKLIKTLKWLELKRAKLGGSAVPQNHSRVANEILDSFLPNIWEWSNLEVRIWDPEGKFWQDVNCLGSDFRLNCVINSNDVNRFNLDILNYRLLFNIYHKNSLLSPRTPDRINVDMALDFVLQLRCSSETLWVNNIHPFLKYYPTKTHIYIVMHTLTLNSFHIYTDLSI